MLERTCRNVLLLFFGASSLIFLGCAKKRPRDHFSALYRETYTGFDIDNQELGCKQAEDHECENRPMEPLQERYKSECEELGHKAINCGCQYYICTQNIWKGRVPPKNQEDSP